MSLPAGYSDEDEDSDFETFYFEPIKKQAAVQQRVRSPEEKLLDAVYSNDLAGVAAALTEGADIHHRIRDYSPVMQAAYEGHFEILKFLIQNGAHVNDEHNMVTVLMCLCISWSKDEEKLLKCLKFLLEQGANLKATNWTLATPLMLAVRLNHILLVTHFLELGCDVNVADSDGYTPIIIAAQNENLAMVKLLLNAGANTHVRDRRGDGLEDVPQVSSNPELAAMLGIQIDDGTVEQVQPIYRSQYKMVVMSLPKKTDRMFGFHDDAIHFVSGIGLHDVSKVLSANSVQLAELLTWRNGDWDAAGVHLSYYVRKIELCVKKYHEHPWSKGAIPKVENVIVNGDVDLFKMVQFLMDFLRVMHISSATSLFMLKNSTSLKAAAVKDIDKILRYNSIARGQLQSIRKVILSLESSTNTVPPDLITTDDLPKQNSRSVFRFVGVVLTLCSSWSLPLFSDIEF